MRKRKKIETRGWGKQLLRLLFPFLGPPFAWLLARFVDRLLQLLQRPAVSSW